MSNRRLSKQVRRRGATLVLVCILGTVLAAMVTFGMEIGRMYLVRSQLQTAVDAGALAATLQLKQDGNDIEGAKAAARRFVQLNRVGWLVTIPENAIDVTVGTWDAETKTFSQGGTTPDAVQVAANATDQPFFFGRMLGRRTFNTPLTAVANGGGGALDIMLALDLSGSMGQNGRIEALRSAAPDFVTVISEAGDRDRIGVMGYGALPDQYDPFSKGHSGTAYTSAPQSLYPSGSDWVGVLEADLTFDYGYLTSSVLDSNTLIHNKYNGWTPIGAALRDSAHYLEQNARSGVDKVIVLMSDGHANKPDGDGPGYARDMAEHAAALDIKVYTISLGNAADNDLMRDIASLTKGEFFEASGESGDLSDDLSEAFRSAADAIKRTQLVK